MSIAISIEPKVLYYSAEEYSNWMENKRETCIDPYCKALPGTYGFGESVVGQHFEKLGYLWIHHDYNVVGGNRPGKYPKAEEILIKCIGEEKFQFARTLSKAFGSMEEPDLMIYRPDFSEIRFAESKLTKTKDKIRPAQLRGLAIYSLLLGVEVDVFEVAPSELQPKLSTICFEF